MAWFTPLQLAGAERTVQTIDVGLEHLDFGNVAGPATGSTTMCSKTVQRGNARTGEERRLFARTRACRAVCCNDHAK